MHTYIEDNFQSVIPQSALLTQKLVTSMRKTQCYMLTFFNPNQPLFKPISCSDTVLKSFYCIIPGEKKTSVCNSSKSLSSINNIVHTNFITVISRKCSSGEIISTLYFCDGQKDCSDGSDESNCTCYIEGKVINDSNFCSEKCSQQIQCRCSTLFTNNFLTGCVSFKSKEILDMKQGNDSYLAADHYDCGNIQISKDAIDDLIFDCPNGEDEPELKSIFLPYKYRCPKPNMIECHPGHSKCYTNIEQCVYNLTIELRLMYCRNGQHLQSCEDAICISMFKCPCSYCIPHRYRCDGKWDCWNGYDESFCVFDRCNNLFKCKSSVICVDTKNVCDATIDCPLGEDEMLCGVTHCISQCLCFNHGIYCDSISVISSGDIFELLKNFIFIKLNDIKTELNSIDSLTMAEILICSKSNISENNLCQSLDVKTNIKHLDLSGNIVKHVYSNQLLCLEKVIQVILNDNKISSLTEYAFVHLQVLKFLDLGRNKIKLLKYCAFCNLVYLQYLNLLDNNIFQVSKTIFNSKQPILISTLNFHVCCATENTLSICTSKPSWPSSCNSLFSKIGLKAMAWIMILSIIFPNILSMLRIGYLLQRTEQVSEYEMFVFLINLCDLSTGCYILGIGIKDVISGDSYTETDLSWRSSIVCHGLAFILLCSVVLSAFFMLTVSISRYRVVVNPFKKPFSISSIKLISLCIPISFLTSLVIVFIVRYQVEGLILLSSPLCTILGKTDESIGQQVVTITVSLYLLSVFLIITIIYCCLILLTKKSKTMINETKIKHRQRQMTRHVILVGITNAMCWVPSSLFYLISFFVKEFPVFWLFFVTLFILPINSVLNPVIFNLSDIIKFVSSCKKTYLTKLNSVINGDRSNSRKK